MRSAAVDSEADLVATASDAHALVVTVNTPVTAAVLDECDSLRIVARTGVDIDNVDVQAAADHDVVVTNVPEYCHDEVTTTDDPDTVDEDLTFVGLVGMIEPAREAVAV